jgi:hypothetical protein
MYPSDERESRGKTWSFGAIGCGSPCILQLELRGCPVASAFRPFEKMQHSACSMQQAAVLWIVDIQRDAASQ